MLQETWDNMMTLQIPAIEKMIRPIIVYLMLIVLFRIFGRRELAQLNPMDLTVLLLLSNTVQNAIIGDDDSLIGAVYGVIALLGVNWLVNAVTYRSPRISKLIEGRAGILIEDGEVDTELQAQQKISDLDLDEALHREGIEHPSRVRKAHLEPSGQITIIPRDDQRIDELLTRLAAIEALLRENGPRAQARAGDA